MMKKTGVSFNDVYEYCKAGDMKSLAEKCPLHATVLDMVIRFLPNPLDAQRERVPVIWHGGADSEIGKSMVSANAAGDLAFMVTDISIDPHAGEVATGRLFSGSFTRGMEVYTSGTAKKSRVQQVGIFMGPERLEVEKIPAGNIAAVTG
jgi:elongation factor 2